jgi:tRNA(Ile)-lysidine synthase
MSNAQQAVADVPAGAWAVGVSGGADSVALLVLLRERTDLSLCAVHLDHETRQGGSAADAEFVEKLAAGLNAPVILRRRGEVEATMQGELSNNKSARFRAARLELFRQVVTERSLRGVILAHHADDQAETVFQRLLRGAGPTGLRGMSPRAVVGGLEILRPMLGVRRAALRSILVQRQINWREDESNDSLQQQRSRVRKVLADQPDLTDAMLRLGSACARWADWLARSAPRLAESFAMQELDGLPMPIAEFAARRWLAERINHRRQIPPNATTRLIEMATDAATPARWQFPGGLVVRRRGGRIFSETR